MFFELLGKNSFVQNEAGRTVLFASGQEFLICKVERLDKMTNIYLRNVTLGFSNSQTYIWTDESNSTMKFAQCERMLSYRTRFNERTEF